MADGLLEVRDLRKVFHRRRPLGFVGRDDPVAAVDGVSFDLAAGECLGVVGESGCGKTTLGRTLLRLLAPTSGSIRYEGEDLLALTPRVLRDRRGDLQMIFQDLDAALNPKMCVGDLLAEAIELRAPQSTRQATRRRSEELIDLVKLKSAKLAAFPPDLSGGEKRRVSIARVLAVKPRLIVADEPLSALDVSIAAQVANLMRDLQRNLGLTYLFISHDLRMVELVADRVMVMYLGKVVEMAGAQALAHGALHPYSQLLWSAVNAEGGRRAPEGVLSSGWELAEQERPHSGCRFRNRCPVYVERGEPIACEAPEQEPVLREIAPGHSVACHFAEPV